MIKPCLSPCEIDVTDIPQTANAVSADYDKASGFFEELRSYLHRLKVLEHQVPPIPELHVVIIEVLTSVLVLCGICTKYIQTKRIGKHCLMIKQLSSA